MAKLRLQRNPLEAKLIENCHENIGIVNFENIQDRCRGVTKTGPGTEQVRKNVEG